MMVSRLDLASFVVMRSVLQERSSGGDVREESGANKARETRRNEGEVDCVSACR